MKIVYMLVVAFSAFAITIKKDISVYEIGGKYVVSNSTCRHIMTKSCDKMITKCYDFKKGDKLDEYAREIYLKATSK